MEATPNLGVLQLAEVPVDLEDELVEVVSLPVRTARPESAVEAEIPMDLRLDEELPDLAPYRRQLGRVQGGDLGVLVEEGLL